VSHDGGASFEHVARLSPDGTDAGEADLLVTESDLQCAFRAGPEWESRIFHTSSKDGAAWSEPKPLTPEEQFAEYPMLSVTSDGVTRLQFYCGARKDRQLFPTTRTAATEPAMPPAARAVLKQFAMSFDGHAWSEPRRVLTGFPEVQATWLEVEFHLISPRADYSPHEISVLLNGYPLLHLTGVIPEGTYLLPFDPALLSTDPTGLPQNVIGRGRQRVSRRRRGRERDRPSEPRACRRWRFRAVCRTASGSDHVAGHSETGRRHHDPSAHRQSW
jgi:hypothetical protein